MKGPGGSCSRRSLAGRTHLVRKRGIGYRLRRGCDTHVFRCLVRLVCSFRDATKSGASGYSGQREQDLIRHAINMAERDLREDEERRKANDVGGLSLRGLRPDILDPNQPDNYHRWVRPDHVIPSSKVARTTSITSSALAHGVSPHRTQGSFMKTMRRVRPPWRWGRCRGPWGCTPSRRLEISAHHSGRR